MEPTSEKKAEPNAIAAYLGAAPDGTILVSEKRTTDAELEKLISLVLGSPMAQRIKNQTHRQEKNRMQDEKKPYIS